MELDRGETGGGPGQRAPSRRSHLIVNVFTIFRFQTMSCTMLTGMHFRATHVYNAA